MNYNSVEEILSAETTNMTVLRNNTKQDDGTDTITGVSWFNFNGIIASNIYASGNSFIGFGSPSEHLKVNQRDGAMYSLYREEGILYDYYKFLKIRWSGYSRFNYTTDIYKLEYDVILWDTGDISLHMISIPTSYNTGTYSLTASSTYNYTVNTSSPDVTFIKTDSGFEVQNNIINLEPPYERRFLLRDGSTIYTILNGTLSSLGNVEITTDLFLNSGVKNIPEFSLLNNLTNPELLYWHDKTDEISGLTIKGVPPLPQIILYESQTIPNGSFIENMEAAATDDALFCITLDGGITWQYYNGNSWALSTSALEGMNKKELKAIPKNAWTEITSSRTYQIRCALPTVTSAVRKIAVKYT